MSHDDRLPVFPPEHRDWLQNWTTFQRYLQTQWQRMTGLNLSRFDDLLYVGGEFRASDWPQLHALGLRAVLSLQAEREDRFVGPPPERALRLPVEDFAPPSLDQLQQAVRFIDTTRAAGLPLLVHCHAGVGRAPLTLAAWLVHWGDDHATAFARVRQARPIAALNTPQYRRLLEWEAYVRTAPESRPA